MKESHTLMKDILAYAKERKKYWLAPLIFILLLLATLIVVLEGSVVAPLIYTIF